MAAPNDTATPATNLPAMPPGQGQAADAGSDPMTQYSMLQERAQKLATMSQAPILKFETERAEFIRQYSDLNNKMSQDLQAKQAAMFKKQGMLGFIGSVAGGALTAVTTFFLFSRNKKGFWKKVAVPSGGFALGGIIGGAIGAKMGSGNAGKQFSEDQKAVLSANNDAVEKLCDAFQQQLDTRVQQLAMTGTLPDGQVIPGQAPASSAKGNDHTVTPDDLRQPAAAGAPVPAQPKATPAEMMNGNAMQGTATASGMLSDAMADQPHRQGVSVGAPS